MEIKKTKCEKCGSTQIYYRQTTNEFVCKTCGYTKLKNIEEETPISFEAIKDMNVSKLNEIEKDLGATQ